MDPIPTSTPPSHRSNPGSQIKSASRLARIRRHPSIESEELVKQLSLDLITSPSPKKTSSFSPSLPIHELLSLSPSPMRKSRTRIVDRVEYLDEGLVEPIGNRKRCKNRGSQMGSLGCASPRNNRRSRRKSEMETREERDVGFVDENVKLRKRKHGVRSKKEKLSMVPCGVPSSCSSPKMDDADQGKLDKVGQMLYDLIMWRDVAKSTLWFGFGCLCFLSSCFARGINFSIFSIISQLGLVFLGGSFLSNSFFHRNNNEEKKRNEFKVKEDDILRCGRLILPATNLAISKTRELFSGEPSMTLKVVPFLLLGAEYGHLITMRSLCVIGFFVSFTIPKLYSCYSNQITLKAKNMKSRMLEAWGACSHKKVVAIAAVMAFWNLSSVKIRIFTAFIALVILRCSRQHLVSKLEEGGAETTLEEEQKQEEQQQEMALVVVGKKEC